MTAAAARKKQIDRGEPLKPEERIKGLWIDRSRLPTTLAKGSRSAKQFPIAHPPAHAHTKEDRILHLADVLFGNVEKSNRKRRQG